MTRPRSSRQRGILFPLRTLPPLLLIASFLGVWQFAVEFWHVPEYLFPAPGAVWDAALDNRVLLLTNTIPTVQIAVYGLALALLVGTLLAGVIHSSRIMRQSLYPILVTTQTVPLIALAPLLVVVLGFSILPKLVLVCLICFFPIVVNTTDGLASVDPDLVKLLRTLGAGRWTIFRVVEWPSALPALFSGARVAATYSVIGALVGEWAGSYEGLGHIIIQTEGELNTGVLFAAFAILSLLGIGLFALVALAERLLLPWRHVRKHTLASDGG